MQLKPVDFVTSTVSWLLVCSDFMTCCFIIRSLKLIFPITLSHTTWSDGDPVARLVSKATFYQQNVHRKWGLTTSPNTVAYLKMVWEGLCYGCAMTVLWLCYDFVQIIKDEEPKWRTELAQEVAEIIRATESWRFGVKRYCSLTWCRPLGGCSSNGGFPWRLQMWADLLNICWTLATPRRVSRPLIWHWGVCNLCSW